MASRTIGTAAALLALGGALALFAAQTGEGPKPLVRKDLLVFGTGKIAPPVRDIFRPRPATAPAGAAARPVRPSVTPGVGDPEPPRQPAFVLNITYIGSIKSGGKTIALVLRGGQTLSVSEGDEIAPGYTVMVLTADAIIVRGPTGETRTFPRQGDRP